MVATRACSPESLFRRRGEPAGTGTRLRAQLRSTGFPSTRMTSASADPYWFEVRRQTLSLIRRQHCGSRRALRPCSSSLRHEQQKAFGEKTGAVKSRIGDYEEYRLKPAVRCGSEFTKQAKERYLPAWKRAERRHRQGGNRRPSRHHRHERYGACSIFARRCWKPRYLASSHAQAVEQILQSSFLQARTASGRASLDPGAFAYSSPS